MPMILTVEDNVETQLILKKSLDTKYDVKICYNLTSAREFLNTNQADLILLDLVLPDGSGLNLFKDLNDRESTSRVPTIILSSVSDIETKVIGLESGADDYILKPFNRQELLARIESVLRRGPVRYSESTMQFADLVIDVNSQSAGYKQKKGLKDLRLTPIEFKILMVLIRQFGNEISRDTL